MNNILLDPVGDAPLPDGYTLIENEVDFLRHAPSGMPLLVRGIHLCDWARNFYPSRRIDFRETHSPIRELQTVMPELADSEALELYRLLGGERFAALDRPLSPLSVLEGLYPGSLWNNRPSQQHAAEWLLWLYEKDPPPSVQSALLRITEQWRDQASGPEAEIYEAVNKATAQAFLEGWLYIQPDSMVPGLGEFPLIVPAELNSLAVEQWRKRIVTSEGDFFHEIPPLPLPGGLKSMAAQETYKYLRSKPQQLNHTLYQALEPYLSLAQQNELAKVLPPDPPESLPDTAIDVLAWFEQQYLPFRRWQSRFGDEVAVKQADSSAREFGLWYLDRYPNALMGGAFYDYLSYRQFIDQSKKAKDVVTFIAVLDGLHVDDAQQLRREIESRTARLTLLQNQCVFAPLPTVTTFTKEAMLKGVSPRKTGEVGYLGDILPESKDPSDRIEHLVRGDVLIWRVMEPDATYHGRNKYETLARDVEAALANVAQKLTDIVERVSSRLPLRIIVVTDHGRLFAKASRVLPTPTDMESHGRAAWGTPRTKFGKSGYAIDDDVVYLHGESFGLPIDAGEAAVMIGSAMFKTNDAKGGSEEFPHGGLYPEEVIIPWMVWERDWVMPSVEITLQGRGTAGRAESATVRIVNVSDVSLTVQELRIRRSGEEIDVLRGRALESPSQSPIEYTVVLEPWPSEAELGTMSARATISLAAGRVFESGVALKLESQELYQRDNILEDLDL